MTYKQKHIDQPMSFLLETIRHGGRYVQYYFGMDRTYSTIFADIYNTNRRDFHSIDNRMDTLHSTQDCYRYDPLTIHKSQGTEYPAVVIPIHTQHYTMLQRNLLYTAITRARKLVVIVGTQKAVAIAVKRVDSRRRVTLLKERLTKFCTF
jgi:superfamily I DNA/RNA helicase